MTTTMRLAGGEAFGHYQLIERLDKSGGIEIWHAQHCCVQMQVVLKIALKGQRTFEEYDNDVRLLQNEAQVLSGLHHHFILSCRDYLVGRDYGALVLEYAPPGSLAQNHRPGHKLPL